MPDNQGQMPTIAGDQASQTAAQTAGAAAQTGQESDIERFDAEYVRGLRKEAAGYRKRLQELEAQRKADEEAKLGEGEKIAKRLADAERAREEAQGALRKLKAERAIALSASQVGIDAELATRLLSAESLEMDDDGAPKDVEKVLRGLLARWPTLAAGQAGSASATNPARGHSTQLTREDIARMTPDQINARWTEVQQVLAEGR